MNLRKCFKSLVALVLVFCFMAAFIPKKALAREDDWRNSIGESFRFKDTEELCNITEYDLRFTITKKALNGKPGEVSVTYLISFKDSKTPIKIPTYVTHQKTKCSYYVTTIHNEAFINSEIEEVILHDKITKIGEKAFMGAKIKTVTIPASVKEIGSKAFSFCYYLTEIIIDEENPNYYSQDNTFLLSKNGKTLFSVANIGDIVNIPQGVKRVESCALSSNIFVDEDTFNQRTKIKKITYPNTVRYIGDHNLNTYIVIFKGKTTPEIYDNNTTVEQVVAPKGNLEEYKQMMYDGKNVFSANSYFSNKIKYLSKNKKFLSKLNPEDYMKNDVYYKEITNFTQKFVKSLKKKNPSITEKEIVIEILRYIRNNYTYDFDYYHKEIHNPSSRTARFLFKNKIGYDNSFTNLANYMLREIGIPCTTVTFTKHTPGDYNGELFNVVYLDGNWIMVNFTRYDLSAAFDYLEIFSIGKIIYSIYN